MSEKIFVLQHPITVKNSAMHSILVNEVGIFGVTNQDESIPISSEMIAPIARMIDSQDSFETRVDLVQNILDTLPVKWLRDGENIAAITPAGRSIVLPLQQIYELTGTHDLNLALEILNAPWQQEKEAAAIAVGAIAGELAKGIAGKVGAYIGGLILDKAFPEKPLQSYFDELYEKIARLVHKAILENQMQLINGKINGTMAFIRNVYIPVKQKATSKKELLSMLLPYVNEFYQNVTYTLQTPNYREPGFSVFLLSASLHLSLLQECALVDPATDNPRNSGFAEAVSKQAKEYLNFARLIWSESADSISQKRRNHVILNVRNGTYPLPPVFLLGQVIDNFINSVIYETHDLNKWIFHGFGEQHKHQQKVVDELSKGLAGEAGIDALFGNWKILESNPIPILKE